MNETRYQSLDSSIIYRCSSKYFDKVLSEYDLGYTGMLLLVQIYEHENISMNELASLGAYDKGTITKAIQKLEAQGYVKLETSAADKRSKLLSTTNEAQKIMPVLYQKKNEWISYLCSELNADEMEAYFNGLSRIVEKARNYSRLESEESNVRFYGLQKLTLLDYPGQVAATLFTGWCNYRCPFCHNRSLVFLNENDGEIAKDDILDFLSKRKGVLDGVCITGGEPTLHAGLRDFIASIKEMGLKVKLDTNGSHFEVMKELVEDGLIDYVAMDIKNCPKKYAVTVGVEDYDLSDVRKSVKYLLEDHVEYEFRTTVVSQFHEIEDIKEIGKWIKGARNYYLQNFEDHGTCITSDLSACDTDTLKKMLETMKEYVENVAIRGIKE
ncbi:MAG: anaerobic ribonucleoside-triphosphate reductase activating protein [Erysipelotrichaceae bacterium]|nr:anaerobic ribonucleoside-triphosphate reductase activating protein [Erysipelotrichaceae bacterium]